MIRIAAVGDLHFDRHSSGRLRAQLDKLDELADCLLLAGDLTQRGTCEEANVLAAELVHARIPTVAVLGNHDYHSNKQDEVTKILQDVGVHVLERQIKVLDIAGFNVGIAGLKGFGGGFANRIGHEFGEPEMKSFIRQSKNLAGELDERLTQLQDEYLTTDFRIVLMHYSPTVTTLQCESREVYPFLVSSLLADVIDKHQVDAVFHGHAHHGIAEGRTPKGIKVFNVALPVIQHPYNIYRLDRQNFYEFHDGKRHQDNLVMISST